MKVVNVDSINYHLIDGGYYADKDDIDELDSTEMYTNDEVIAMLTELQLDLQFLLSIEEQKRDELSYQQTWNYPLNVCISIIQQKINALKENTDGME